MKKWLLSFGILVAVLAVALRAQDITGIWQGTLSLPGPNGQTRDVRAQIRIESGGASMKATLRMIDQGPGAMPATVTLQGSAVKITIPGMGGTYDGRLTDATTMEGNLRQPPAPVLKLDLKKVTEQAAWVAPPAPPRPAAMPSDWKPAFDVATIKLSQPDTPGQSITVRGRTFRTQNQTVSSMMTFAFGLHPDQIVGGPEWMKQDRFDITAEPEGSGMPTEKQWRAALEKLLADRYNLKFHRDKKELSVYALTQLKSGHKLTPNDTDPNGLPGLFFRGLGIFPVRNATMGDFANTMQAVVLDRPVVDQTGIQGRYDFVLTWTPDETQFGGRGGQAPPAADPANAPPGLFTAIQEQLGLKLEAAKSPVEVLVIDQLEKPTPN
jgi:uncharacterized protein (TIGR03435 family)